MTEDEPTPERLLEMAEHIVEAIAHHHKYRELDVEILGETSRRLRLMAAAPSLRAELAEAKAEIARLTEERDQWHDSARHAEGLIEAALDRCDQASRSAALPTLSPGEVRRALGVGPPEAVRRSTIVEAATALAAHFRLGFLIGSDEEMAKWQTAHDALCHRLLTAVEEGNRT